MNYKEKVAHIFADILENELSYDDILHLIEKPKQIEFGDYAFPCFTLAKVRKMNPNKIAHDISEQIESDFLEKVEVVGGYINVFLNKNLVSQEIVYTILTEKSSYGSHNFGNNGIVTIDMSSPNIAKPFSMGHLRSTVIGNSISLLLEKCGYKTIKINHLGDWGTQFGKLITAYKYWGDEQKVKENPIKELLKLYVKFHEEAETNPSLGNEGRLWFKKLEDQYEEAVFLWKWFRKESLTDFERIYKMLNIQFDSFAGEAFYNDKMDSVIVRLSEMGLLVESDEALVVKLEENLPPCLIKRSDGATLYATRDLAAAIYRKNTYHFVKSLYVVGNEQTLHFKQLKSVLSKMNFEWANDIEHISFGMIRQDGKKMSTRKGKVIFLEDVLNESIELARTNIEEKNPDLFEKEKIAKMVGIGAIVFNDLKNYRMNDIDFSLADITRFEGETGPYVQYTNTRACSILRKAKWSGDDISLYFQVGTLSEWQVISHLADFPNVVERALLNYDPSIIAKYVIKLSQFFNKYYAETKILNDDENQKERLAVVSATSIVLTEGLRLLGLEAPTEM